MLQKLVVKEFLLTLWNTYSFFVLYANLDQPDLRTSFAVSERAEIDQWLITKLHHLIRTVTNNLDAYDATTAARSITDFVVNNLSNWYVRRNRRRFWKSSSDSDKLGAYLSLYEALVTVIKLCAPMTPFISEVIYQNLVLSINPEAPISVHLSDWPEANQSLINDKLLQEMDILRRIIELGRSARSKASVKIRQPLSEMLVRVATQEELEALQKFESQLMDELNVKKITFLDFNTDFVGYKLRPNLPVVGKRLGAKVPKFKEVLKIIDAQKVVTNVRRNEKTTIDLGDQILEFEPDSFLIDVTSPEGYAAVENGSYLVALSINLTTELIQEGQVREVIRFVQNSRKKAGLEVSDYIHLGLDTEGDILSSLQLYEDLIKTETLATDIQFAQINSPQYIEDIVVEDIAINISLCIGTHLTDV